MKKIFDGGYGEEVRVAEAWLTLGQLFREMPKLDRKKFMFMNQ